ncbi:MAG TPA: DUF11 domain-containing protein, partial [Symbiobacteriaceae bacterium]|nr:DUF11 domain-containing protein [Symbiobacteriaceae bacterium]
MGRGLIAVATGAALLALYLPAVPAAAAAPIVVTTVTDTVDANPGDGNCLDATNQCSLRAAIMEANARAGADTIVVPPGTYVLARGGRDENAAATGDLDITDAVTIVGAGGNPDGDPSLTVIDGGGIDKVLSVNPAFTLAFDTTIQALTIQNGNNTSSRVADGFGGGLDWEASGTGTLTIYNCVIQNNITAQGDGGGLTLTNTPGNAAGRATITKSVITNNRASAGIGGGIFIGTTTPFTITDSVISNNEAFDGPTGVGAGAGIFVFGPVSAGAQSSISGSTISGNIAHGNGADGGGLYSTAALLVSNSTFSGNQSGRDGGGYYSSLEPGKAVTLTNVTFSGNTAAGKGGGFAQNVFSSGSPAMTVTITNVTATGNRAADGGGLHMKSGAGVMTLRNTLVAGNFLGNSGTANDVGGTLDAASAHNLFGTGGAGGLTNGVNGNQVGVSNPRLGPLANNGGLTQTHALLAGSPALDAGNNALTVGSTDQRGSARQADAADANTTATVDIGAFEAHPAVEDITDKSGMAGVPLAVTFNVGDAALGIGAVTATSSNPAMLPSLPVTGSGATRTLTLTATQAGTATITVTAAAGMGSMSDTFQFSAQAPTDLTVTKAHTGDFRQGQQGATYTVTVRNSGGQPTDGTTVTLTEAPPAGLSVVSMSGNGWTCPAGSLACTRSGALAAGASYPPVTVTVNVADDALASVTNTVTVSGGGDAVAGNNSASDVTTVTPVADLTIAKSHTGNFTPGQTGATFSITVTNAGAGPTLGAVTVTDTLPTGLTLTGLSGSGWTCPPGGASCTRSDALAAGASYPAITATVDVAADARGSLTNQVAVSGGGELNTGNNTASDTAVVDAMPDLVVTKSHTGDFRQGQQGAAYTLTVQNAGFSDTTGDVTVTDTLPAGLTGVAMSGTGWTCDLPALSCTRS